jgi:acyl carrier protein
MSDEEFLRRFEEVVGENASTLTLATELNTLDGWDSVAYLGTTVLIDEGLGVIISPEVIVESLTVGDLLTAARAAQG